MKNYLRFASNFISLNNLFKITSQKIFLPFYHTISNNRLPHISNLYSLRNEKLFKEDIDYLCKHFTPVSIDELFDIVHHNKQVTKPIMHLTFDDGLKEIHSTIAPILEEKGVPATIFINSGFVDNKDLFYRYKVSLIIEELRNNKKRNTEISKILNFESKLESDLCNGLLRLTIHDLPKIELIAKLLDINFNEYLLNVQPYLTSSQISDLIKRGFTIGSHSINHPFFKDISSDERKRQVSDSFTTLKNKFNLQNNYFSFPFSDESVDTEFFKWMYNEQNCRLSFGISGLKKDFSKYHLHRIPFEGALQPAKDIVKTEYLYFIIKAFFNKNIYKRQ